MMVLQRRGGMRADRDTSSGQVSSTFYTCWADASERYRTFKNVYERVNIGSNTESLVPAGIGGFIDILVPDLDR